MRLGALTASLCLLAACGGKTEGNQSAAVAGNASSGFEGGFRSAYRTKFVESCSTGAKQAAASAGNKAAAGVDYAPLCGCAADRLLATKSMAELARGPSQAEQLAVTQACLKEHPLTA